MRQWPDREVRRRYAEAAWEAIDAYGLTETEGWIVALLQAHEGGMATVALLRTLWGPQCQNSRLLARHIDRLRAKLDATHAARQITMIRSVGYVLTSVEPQRVAA